MKKTAHRNVRVRRFGISYRCQVADDQRRVTGTPPTTASTCGHSSKLKTWRNYRTLSVSTGNNHFIGDLFPVKICNYNIEILKFSWKGFNKCIAFFVKLVVFINGDFKLNVCVNRSGCKRLDYKAIDNTISHHIDYNTQCKHGFYIGIMLVISAYWCKILPACGCKFFSSFFSIPFVFRRAIAIECDIRIICWFKVCATIAYVFS